MRYRLDDDTYVNDRLVPKGLEVGDGPESYDPWKYPINDPHPELRGKFRPPGRYMTPLDDEAREAFKAHFGEDALVNRPETDPNKAIPITTVPRDAAGNVKSTEPPKPEAPKTEPELRPLPPQPKNVTQVRDNK